MNVMKEREIDALVTLCVNAHVAYLLAVWQATAAIEDSSTGESDPNDCDNIITTKEAKTTDAFFLLSYTCKDEESSPGGRD